MAFKLEGAQDAIAPSKPFKLEGAEDATQKDSSFMERVKNDISERKATAKKDIFLEDQSPASATLQGIGQYMAIGGDIAGEAVKSGVNSIPEYIKQPITNTAKKAAHYVANTDIGKAGMAKALEAKQSLGDIIKAHPEAARNVGAVANIASAFPASLGASIGEKGALKAGEAVSPLLKNAGEGMVQKAEEKAAAQKSKDFINLVSPKETKKVAEENIDKSIEKGFFRKAEVVPDKNTLGIAKTVSQVPGIDPARSYLYNINKIKAENKAEANRLMSTLKAANITIPPDKISQAATEVKKSLAQESFMIGDAKKAANIMIKKAAKLIKKNGSTAEGLLRTRQQFDIWAKSQVKGIAAGETNTARKASWTTIRNSLNKLVEESVPNAKVKDSLTRQSHLFGALNNLRPKAAAQGKSGPARAIQKAKNALPEVPFIRPALGMAVAAPYAAYKGISGLPVRRIIGKGLTAMSDILHP